MQARKRLGRSQTKTSTAVLHLPAQISYIEALIPGNPKPSPAPTQGSPGPGQVTELQHCVGFRASPLKPLLHLNLPQVLKTLHPHLHPSWALLALAQ
jgi:hypothetical protein